MQFPMQVTSCSYPERSLRPCSHCQGGLARFPSLQLPLKAPTIGPACVTGIPQECLPLGRLNLNSIHELHRAPPLRRPALAWFAAWPPSAHSYLRAHIAVTVSTKSGTSSSLCSPASTTTSCHPAATKADSVCSTPEQARRPRCSTTMRPPGGIAGRSISYQPQLRRVFWPLGFDVVTSLPLCKLRQQNGPPEGPGAKDQLKRYSDLPTEHANAPGRTGRGPYPQCR